MAEQQGISWPVAELVRAARRRADLSQRQLAGRRYPAHLDTVLDPRPGEWWADRFGLARPPETFHRDRSRRDAQRRRSAWEVRVAQYRSAPEPPRVPDGRPPAPRRPAGRPEDVG